MIGWVIITAASIAIWFGGITVGQSTHQSGDVIGTLIALAGLYVISQAWVRQVTS